MTPNCPKCGLPMKFEAVITEVGVGFVLYSCPEDGELKGVPQ